MKKACYKAQFWFTCFALLLKNRQHKTSPHQSPILIIWKRVLNWDSVVFSFLEMPIWTELNFKVDLHSINTEWPLSTWKKDTYEVFEKKKQHWVLEFINIIFFFFLVSINPGNLIKQLYKAYPGVIYTLVTSLFFCSLALINYSIAKKKISCSRSTYFLLFYINFWSTGNKENVL